MKPKIKAKKLGAKLLAWLRVPSNRWAAAAMLVLISVAQLLPIWQPNVDARRYSLQDAQGLLPASSAAAGRALQFDQKQLTYQFNSDFSPASAPTGSGGSTANGGAKIKATLPRDASQGIKVTDPYNNVSLSLTPKMSLLPAKQDQNRVYYPLSDGSGWLVYSMGSAQVAEDLVLTAATSNKLNIDYQLGLDNGLAARMLPDGSIGVYGSDLPINGQVSTGTAKDAQLLNKIRQNTAKNKLLFTLPRPVIRQSGLNTPDVKASYKLKGSTLTLAATGLNKGHYPLDIDPSVYVASASGLMYGNNETNTNFDTTNNLFEKTPVSGGNIRDGVSQTSWSTTGATALPSGLWASGVAISGGFIYVVGGSTGTRTNQTNTVYWAPLNVSSSNPIGTWTTNTGYNLPVGLMNLSLVAYNDYLYAIGGLTSAGAVSSNIYELHLATSGEPTPAWTAVTNALPGGAGKQLMGAVAYRNALYVMGGLTAATGTTGTTAVYSASISPNGQLGSWNTLATLPASLWGLGASLYNGYIYVAGGAVGATPQTSIYYAKITGPGAISSWLTNANSFTTGRSTQGGNFMTIWAGYMYISGGCATLNASGYCSVAPQGDIQEASINADGSISAWTTLQYYNTGSSAFANISQPRLGYGLVSFGTANNASAYNAGGSLYAIGGCATAQNTSTGACAAPLTTTTQANISSEGDIGPAQATTSLPAGAGGFASGVVINNGYIYNVGGCSSNGCTSVTSAIYYNTINANGTLGATWTATSNALPAAVAAMGITVYNNTIYTFGGATGSGAIRNGAYVVLGSNGNSTSATAVTNILPAVATYVFAFAHSNPAASASGYVYTVGGCTTTSGIGCSSSGYLATVQKCTVTTGSAPSGCTTTGQLQLPVGTGIAAGATSGNYAYLASGANGSTSGTAGSWGGQTNLTYFVKIDSSGNLVLPPGKTGTKWPTTTGLLADNGQTDSASDNAPGQRRRSTAMIVNGYLYVLAGHDANGDNGAGSTLQDVEIGKIDPTTGDIASFTDNYYQITPRWDFRAAAANGFIYAVGGCSAGPPPSGCTATDKAVQFMNVYNNYSGAPAGYTAATGGSILPTPVANASSAVYNGYLYVAGGQSTYGAAPIRTMQYAPINADGSIGTWTSIAGGSTGSLGTARMNFNIVASGGYLYAIGGQSGTAISTALATTERAALDPVTGAPGAFSASSSLTTARAGLDARVYNGYIYTSGGQNTAGTYLASTEYASIDPSTGVLGTWTVGTSFTTARANHISVAYNGTLYIIGGNNASSYYGDVQYAQINTNGSLGSFSNTMQLPQPVSGGSAFAANGYLYVLAGRSNATTTGCTNNTYVASINANSTVASGNVPNGLGTWSQTAVTYSGTRYGTAASYYGGKVYLFGGSQCATNAIVTAATSTYYATLQSQPQVAQYSYAVDAIYDVFPSKSLFNGIDNGIGASWVLDYMSSTNANAAWGVDYSYGKTTLGTPQPYVPYDGSGINTNYARWYWVELTIDASQAFGYPEDVSRGPTINNLILQFTANPSQRLRHGKTFINNVQQPLDAPF